MNRPLAVAAAGLVVVIAAISLNFYIGREDDPPPRSEDVSRAAPTPTPATSPVQTAPEPAPATQAGPSFDVVRVNPQGDTVIAGRAVPGCIVAVFDGGEPIGEVKADGNGEWVFLPDKPLPPGSRQLSLEMRCEGADPVPSESVVVLVVPEQEKDIAGRPDSTGRALALAVPRTGKGGSTVLQAPSTPGADFKLVVEAVDYDDEGNLSISGRVAPAAQVYLYLDGRFIGRSQADDSGRWTLEPETVVHPGLYTLRADQVDRKGKVLARIEFPFSRAEPITDLAPGTFIVVQPGNSLWRMARRLYGTGFNYTVIYDANSEQIRDPDLIYPGQIFALPKGATTR